MFQIENEFINVKSKPEGAELTSIFNKQTNLEYLWQAGKEWPKHAPVLFPIVGTLKDNSYIHVNKIYSLERHGFARTKKFEVSHANTNEITYLLKSDATTLPIYPFEFEFAIKYSINENKLIICYTVKNTGKETMYFSVGGHPAFRVPLHENENYQDYILKFNQAENTRRWLLNNGLIDVSVDYFNDTKQLPLSKSLFYDDALVFKNLKSDCISMVSKNHHHGLHFEFKEFPFFGIWAAKDADFICLEPWHGIADSINSTKLLNEKEGTIALESHKDFTCSYAVTTF